ncbi:MAG: DUF1295 domain-containing protein, partial [Gammaproteobacteria bacterium]
MEEVAALMPLWLEFLVVILLVATALWVWSLAIKDASFIDVLWGLLSVLAVGYYLYRSVPSGDMDHSSRSVLVTTLVTLWGVRLAIWLFVRQWGQPEDRRYQSMRRRNGQRWWWFSLFQVFYLQAVLAWLLSFALLAAVSVPGSMAQAPVSAAFNLSWIDGIAVALFALGFFFEVVGDWQLRVFLNRPDSSGKVLDRGLWGLTRHPNYFGDACIWWSFGLFALANGYWLGILASALMTFLLLK